MSISIELIDSFTVINNRINQAIAEELNKRMRKRITRTKNIFSSAIEGWVREQPEIKSLLLQGVPNSLNATFGLAPGQSAESVNAIVSSVASSISIKFLKITNKLKGGIEFNFQSSDFANLLGLSEGHQITKLGLDLHWLDWLLTKGDTTIIQGYRYEPSLEGRSRGGTMKKGGFFRVNPKYSGTTSDNFITRAFEGREVQLASILSNFLR